MTLEGQHAVVTGGGSGVGEAIAATLAGLGAKVTITGRRAAPLEALAERLPGLTAAPCDVTDPEGLADALGRARDANGPFDILIANAGIAGSKPFHKLSGTDMQGMLDVNVMGVFHSIQAVLPDMRERGSGRIVAIASNAGLKGYGYVAHYCASKHAAIGMIRSLAIEVAPRGITANCVCPSFIDTPMTQRSIDNIMEKTGRSREEAVAALTADNPQGRLIPTQEVAETVAWLCSPGAASVNGQAIALTGGEA